MIRDSSPSLILTALLWMHPMTLSTTYRSFPLPPDRKTTHQQRENRLLSFQPLVCHVKSEMQKDQSAPLPFCACSVGPSWKVIVESGATNVVMKETLWRHAPFVHVFFFDETNYADHVKKYHLVKDYKCSKCNKYYANKFSLNRHIKSCGIIEAKSFRCEICAMAFASADYLREHKIATHEQKMRYKCNNCNKMFRYRSSLAFHREKCQ